MQILLLNVGQLVARKTADLTEAQRKALGCIISQKLRHIDTKKYRKIEVERSSIAAALEELPYYGESLPKGFNSSLPSKVQASPYTKENNPSFVSGLKGLAQAFYRGTRYAVSHPKQALALGLAAQVIPIIAQTGNEFLINQITTSQQFNPSVGVLTNGHVFVAWEGSQAGMNAFNIYGRVFSPSGTALGNEFSINQISSAQAFNPSVAGLTNGNVFVAWTESQAGNPDIYGKVFSSSGVALGSEFLINQITTNYQDYPAVAGLMNGDVFVTWTGDQQGATINDFDIYGRVFSSDGTALGNEFRINQITTHTQPPPSVAGLTNGNVFVAWTDYQAGYDDIYG